MLLNHQIAGDNAQQVEGIVAVFDHCVQRSVSRVQQKHRPLVRRDVSILFFLVGEISGFYIFHIGLYGLGDDCA